MPHAAVSHPVSRLSVRLQPQQQALRAVSHHIEQTIRPLADITGAFDVALQQFFLALYLVARNLQAVQGAKFERTDEQAALPRWAIARAGQKSHTRRRNRRHPVVLWLLHARLGCAFAQLAAAVVFAIGNHRPTVVAARLGLVDFIATLRAVFVHPQLAVWPQRCTLGVAVAVAPDLGQGARLFGERVVGRHGAFGGDADDLAVVVVELLGIVLA